MGHIKRLIWLVLLIVLAVALSSAIPSRAALNDAVITMESIRVFRNLNETGDMLILFHWRWNCDNISDVPASSGVMIDLSLGGLAVTSTNPYVNPLFVDSVGGNITANGYGDGMSSFYSTANPPPQWLGAYIIRIVGVNPPFTAVAPLNYTLTAADYSGNVSQADSRGDLRNYVMAEIDKLNRVYPAVNLKETSEEGQVLSDYGEAYFRAVVPYLEVLCPILFSRQLVVPASMPVQDYNMNTQALLTAQISGTDLERGSNRLGALIGVSGGVIWGLITFAVCLAVFIVFARRGWPVEIGLFISGVIVTGMAAIIGDLIFTLVMIGSLLAAVGIGWALFGKRA